MSCKKKAAKADPTVNGGGDLAPPKTAYTLGPAPHPATVGQYS